MFILTITRANAIYYTSKPPMHIWNASRLLMSDTTFIGFSGPVGKKDFLMDSYEPKWDK